MKTIRKPLSVLLFAVMLISVICVAPFSVSAATKTTSSTADGEFTEISTPEQLMNVINVHKPNSGTLPRQRVKLMNDITINTYGLDSSFKNSSEYNQRFFRGIFDGNNHTITVKSNNASDVLEPLFDQIEGSLNETRIYDLNLVYENDVYGAPFAYSITTTIEDSQPDFQDIDVTFENVIPIANINSNRTCACGFACVTDATKYKSISVSGKNIGNTTPANSTYVLVSGFASSYSNTQSFFEDISIDVDNIKGCAGTDADIVCVTGLVSVPTVVGAFYRDISINVNNNIEATGVSGSNANIVACGVSLSSQYFYNADVTVGGNISAVGYANNSAPYFYNSPCESIIGAFGISFELRSNSSNDTLINAEYFPDSFKNLNDMGAMSVDVEGDIKAETLGSGSCPMSTAAAGASYIMLNEVPFNNTTINVEGNISSKNMNGSGLYNFSAGLSVFGLDKSKRAEKHFSVEHCTINAGNIVSEAYNGYVFTAGAFAYCADFPCKDVHVNANSIMGKGNHSFVAGLSTILSPQYSYGGSKVALDNCSVHAKTITSTTVDAAGLVLDATDKSYTDIIQNCTVEVTDSLSNSDMVEMSLLCQCNDYYLYNNAAIIPSDYSAIYSYENQDSYFKNGNGIESTDSNKYVKFTLLESSNRSKNTYEIDDYDNCNNWENSNTVTIGDKSYKTVCAYTDNSVTGNIGYDALWQLQEIDNSFKFHVNEPNKADRLFRVYNGDDNEDYGDIEDGKHNLNSKYQISAFYDIPKFAEDDYVFAGWYTVSDNSDNSSAKAFKFDSDIPANLTDVYAHWIPVGEVSKDENDDKILPESMKVGDEYKYRGFGLFGVQIRPGWHYDSNYDESNQGGLRFIASVGEDLLSDIDAISDKTVDGNKVEYGFITAGESSVNTVANDSSFNIDKSKYKIQYKGTNVNGVNTTVRERSKNNFNYITNLDCTSKTQGRGGKVYGNNSRIEIDHRNYTNYRLATYVVKYEDDPTGANLGRNVVARAYMRYYDANGLLRTFYNDYDGTRVYGGCSISYNRAAEELKATNEKTAAQ